MAPEKHAILGASSAARWIACPPSALLCAALPDETSPYAEEGTKAHALCEYLLRKELGQETEAPDFDYDDEMLDAAQGYKAYVLRELAAMEPLPEVFIEQRVDYSRWATEGFGTVDCLAVSDGEMKVIDFKYGQGVEVDAERNPQLLCYALGGLDMLGPLYGITRISLHIYQPRRDHISVWSLTTEELLAWAEETLKPAAQLAWEGRGDANPGSWCRFCKGKATCRALEKQNMELAKLDFPEPIGMSAREIADVLPKLDLLIDWAGAVKDHALYRAMQGEKFPGYKLVAGRSVRKFRSEADACMAIKEAGFNPYITKMKGLTELRKEMGGKTFEDVCGGMLIKPAGKPALVPETDKRPELDLSAAADFAN
ncbi:MAG: DUF2800 domain-containing protein [Clostridia bacterium]|nr:DUF2800 domain-containing protein [Clostridia bacterium]